MVRKLVAVIISAILLSIGWLGLTGTTLFVAFIPLLWISASYDDSRGSWWRVFGWAALTFALWNAMTVWWLWFATPIGPVAAIAIATTLNLVAFMAFHTVSKRAPKALAYTLLVTAWITIEYWYTAGDIAWPWLTLGNGFSHETELIQWYEYTGVFGGSLWVLICNIFLFEAIRSRSIKIYIYAAAAICVPMVISLAIYFSFEEPQQSIKVTVVQPNIDCYDKFLARTERDQELNLLMLASQAPKDVDFIAMPETSLPGSYDERTIESRQFISELKGLLEGSYPKAEIVTGASTMKFYSKENKTATSRETGGYYYDLFNTAIGISGEKEIEIHHKVNLVTGVEKLPIPWLFAMLDFLVVDLGGIVGQLGEGDRGRAFTNNGVKIGPAICFEGLFGEDYGNFVSDGAEAMFIISNDGWWGDTPGYRHLFTISRIRAIEHRRAVARSANTGRSGFINARGDIGETLQWGERGAITADISLSDEITIYTKYGDYIARLSQFIAMLSLLYFIAYRIKRKNNLVK